MVNRLFHLCFVFCLFFVSLLCGHFILGLYLVNSKAIYRFLNWFRISLESKAEKNLVTFNMITGFFCLISSILLYVFYFLDFIISLPLFFSFEKYHICLDNVCTWPPKKKKSTQHKEIYGENKGYHFCPHFLAPLNKDN